jgi:hypothetical protein
MLRSVEGFWIRAEVNEGNFTNSYFHFFEPPGQNVYATISLSSFDNSFPRSQLAFNAFAYIIRWTTYGSDGKLVGPFPSMGHAQNAVIVHNCGSLEFGLEVTNNVDAVAQINIFQF